MKKIKYESDDLGLFLLTTFIPIAGLIFFGFGIISQPENNNFLIHIFISILIVFILLQSFFCSMKLFKRKLQLRRWLFFTQEIKYRDIESVYTPSAGIIIIILKDGLFFDQIIITAASSRKNYFEFLRFIFGGNNKDVEMYRFLESKISAKAKKKKK